MLREEEVARIERLVAEHRYSLRGIARLTGFSRGTVGTIARGEHRVQTRRTTLRAIAADQALAELAAIPGNRCPECGALCTQPCAACDARQYRRVHAKKQGFEAKLAQNAQEAISPQDFPCETLGLDLEPDDFARYQEIRPVAIARANAGRA